MNQFSNKNYFTMPNEIFSLGMDASEIAVYAYLRCLENRRTYQCWPSYTTIGNAVGRAKNTVMRYVDALAVTENVKVFREAHRRIRRIVGRGVMVAGGKEKAAVGIAAYHAGDELYAVAGDIFAVEQVAGYEAELRALLLGVQHGGRERGTQLPAALFSFARRAERKRGIKMNVGKMEDFDHNSSRLAVQ